MGKSTALERMRGLQKGKINSQRLGVDIGIGFFFLFSLVFFWEASAQWRERNALVNLRLIQEQLSTELTQTVHQKQLSLRAALATNEVRDVLSQYSGSGSNEISQKLTSLLQEKLSDLVLIEVYSAALSEVFDNHDLPAFGYTKANSLVLARDDEGTAPLEIHYVENKPYIALAQAIYEEKNVVAYVYALFAATKIMQPLSLMNALDVGAVRIQQGSRISEKLVEVRGAGLLNDFNEHIYSIPESILTVVVSRGELFTIPFLADWNLFTLLFFAFVLALLGASLLLWRLRINIKLVMSVIEKVKKILPRKKVEQGVDVILPDKWLPVAITPQMKVKEHGEAPSPALKKQHDTHAVITRSIFRAYDIRGIVGETITPVIAYSIGQAVGSVVRDRELRNIVVGRDARESGEVLSNALIRGLQSTGCNVIDIGQAPTPVVYFAAYHLNVGSAICITGSHNPPEYNGFKIVVGGETLAEEQIYGLYERICENRFVSGAGELQTQDVMQDYIDRIANDVQSERRLKIVVDAGNGIGGIIAPQVLESIGCEVVPLYCEVDGTFPNHHPDPSDPENLQDLIVSVRQLNADFGIALDGDADRLGVVTAIGEIIYPDRLLMLYAMDMLNRNPGATVIYDVKCTGSLQDFILRHGGSPLMWRTGHSLIKAKMREEEALLAGEMSGHFFFAERWYGFDDAIYAAARLCEILGAADQPSQMIFDELPKAMSTPELKIQMSEGAHYSFMSKFMEKTHFSGAQISTIDGVRADYTDGWGLIRCSNTTPCLVLRFEGVDEVVLNRIQQQFREQILSVDASLKLPF